MRAQVEAKLADIEWPLEIVQDAVDSFLLGEDATVLKMSTTETGRKNSSDQHSGKSLSLSQKLLSHSTWADTARKPDDILCPIEG